MSRYNSLVWRKRKERYKRKHTYVCSVYACKQTRRLEMHHRSYAHRFGHEPDRALCLLCRKHHQEVTRIWREERGKPYKRRALPSIDAATRYVIRKDMPFWRAWLPW